MTKIKAVLLDFDGTIINSQPAINDYFFEILEQKNIYLTSKEKKSLGGISINDVLAWLKHEKQFSFSVFEQGFHKIFFWIFKLKTIKPFPGTIKLLKELKKKQIKIAIVTNSPKKYTKKLLHINHLNTYFDVIVSVDDVGVPKPNPKMLGVAATLLNTPYNACIMIDDNEPGILAAKALGMKNIQISQSKKSIADFSINKIEDAIYLIK